MVKSLLAGGSPKAVYRADIDGLRAISVLAVIAFHLNGSLPGGYTGVDVFFVISGFLIGGIVIGEVDEGRFSFITFYERRVRRILPALITTLIASSIAAYLLLGPSELLPFAKSAVAALLSAANIYFYATSGYFQANAIDVPLLHLWSLGVEEQFYLFFPLIVVAVARFRRSALLPLLIAAGIVSLVWSQRELSLHPQAAFYLLQGRAFELTIGIVLLFLSRPRMASWLAAGGVVLLVASMMALNENTAFPGFAALAPCVGTALIIWCADGTLIGRGLSVRPLVYLGKISYPLYLAHWPFIVFGKIAMPALDAGRFAFFVLAGSFVGAIAVYYLVERPIRYGSAVRLRWSMAGGLAMFLVTIVGLGWGAVPCFWVVLYVSRTRPHQAVPAGKMFSAPGSGCEGVCQRLLSEPSPFCHSLGRQPRLRPACRAEERTRRHRLFPRHAGICRLPAAARISRRQCSVLYGEQRIRDVANRSAEA